MKLFDITHPLGPATTPWPEDTAFGIEQTVTIAAGAPVNVSRITLSPHNGTHADAPYHYDDAGLRMDEVPLAPFIGRARLVSLEGRPSIGAADLQGLNLTGVERLLIRTGSCPDLSRFNPGFTYLEADAVDLMAQQGIKLVGTDAHSVDEATSKDLPAHLACGRAGMMILENLNLTAVPPGDYELIALPLRLVGADGSPIRAILRTI
jgi:arylformamidase